MSENSPSLQERVRQFIQGKPKTEPVASKEPNPIENAFADFAEDKNGEWQSKPFTLPGVGTIVFFTSANIKGVDTQKFFEGKDTRIIMAEINPDPPITDEDEATAWLMSNQLAVTNPDGTQNSFIAEIDEKIKPYTITFQRAYPAEKLRQNKTTFIDPTDNPVNPLIVIKDDIAKLKAEIVTLDLK